MEQEIPRIQRIAEIGDAPFQFIEKTESILQGWNAKIRKTVYLFKTEQGPWGYYDKETQQVVEVNDWKGKAALINNSYVKMSLYHRVRLKFLFPLNYKEWDVVAKKEFDSTTTEAIVVLPDTTYKQIMSQLNGRSPESVLKFEFITKKLKGRDTTYVGEVIWVS